MKENNAPTQVKIKPFKNKNDERPRFNEKIEEKKPGIEAKNTIVSLKTKEDLDHISRAKRVTISGLGKTKNGSFKSIMTQSHLSRKSGI